MERFLFVVSLVVFGNIYAQNQWDGSTTSTITTNGKISVGTSTPQTGYSLTVKNTSNTQPNGIYYEINNTSTSTQTGIQSNLTFLGATGLKTGFSQIFTSNSTIDNYGMTLSVNGNNPGNRMGLVSMMFPSANKTECGIYSIVNNTGFPYMPGEDRAAYFIGAVETVARSNAEKVFIVNRRDLASPGFGMDVFRIYGDGKVYATEINVKAAANFPDYVFKPGYQLMPLGDVKSFIETNGHLPNVPSAATVECEGMNIGELNRVMVEKIEELTLYILQQQAEIDALKAKLNQLED